MNGMITWFAHNRVAANLMMALILLSGALVLPLLEREIIPKLEFDNLTIWVGYPGAGPTQVERVVSRKIEAALIGVEGIVDVYTEARKDASVTQIEVSHEYRVMDVLNQVRARVEAIGFPKEVSRPVVKEITVIEPVMTIALTGNNDLYSLNNIANNVVEELKGLSSVSMVARKNSAYRHISVELSESNLQKYRMSFSEVVGKVRSVVLEVTGAVAQTNEGEVSIIGESDVKDGDDFEDLVIRGHKDGARISLADVAKVEDRFIINRSYQRFDRDGVVYIFINRASTEDLIDLAEQVHRFIENKNPKLPSGMELKVVMDISEAVSGRIDLLGDNAISGYLLVLFVLLLFMNLRLSFWTSLGIPISFLGAFFVLYYWGGSLNMVSLFAFILVLGIVVDDAIIVGESIYSKHEEGKFGVDAAVEGAIEVSKPVVFAILTTMIAFSPMLFMPGEEGRLVLVIPVVVISILAFSLGESLLILPAHLSTIQSKKEELIPAISKVQQWFSGHLDSFIQNQYKPFLEMSLNWRYTSFTVFLAAFLISISLIANRWIDVEMVSMIEADEVIATINMVQGTSKEEALAAAKRLEDAAYRVKERINSDLGFDQVTSISIEVLPNNHLAALSHMYLDTREAREVSGEYISDLWREEFGDVPRVQKINFINSIVGGAPLMDIQLSSTNSEQLKKASQKIQEILNTYEGVLGTYDTIKQGKKEVSFNLRPEASDLGVTLAQIAGQIRQAYHGASVQVSTEAGGSVGVNIHYPDEVKTSLWYLENMSIKLPDGSHVPLYTVADLEHKEGPTIIKIHNGKRSIRVVAVLSKKTSERKITAALRSDVLNGLSDDFPGMEWGYAGGQKRSAEITDYLVIAYAISLLGMYLMMATLFGSYAQPLMIMYAIPFGIVGALLGHMLLGSEITLWSMIGMIAVSGVVVNDNLVLVDRINRQLEKGVSLFDSIRDAGVARFRPIVLTSFTTFLGLCPLMFEDSTQAQFLVPMAISLSFGVLFATFISLLLVPVLYNIIDDLKNIRFFSTSMKVQEN